MTTAKTARRGTIDNGNARRRRPPKSSADTPGGSAASDPDLEWIWRLPDGYEQAQVELAERSA